MSSPQNGTSNTGLEGQCTWGANQWYHEATGYWVPWSANAKDYATQAPIYGWSVSPYPVVPSIICFQPGIQGANGQYGHVAFAHDLVGKNGVIDRNLNYGPNPSVPTDLTNYAGIGVSFIFAGDAKGRPIGSNSSSATKLSDNASQTLAAALGPSADVTQLLALLDVVFDLINPFDVQNVAQIDVGIPNVADIKFDDPVSYAEGLGMNIAEDMAAMFFRLVFLVVGIFILFKVSSNWIDYGAIAKDVGTIAMMA